MGVGTLFKVVNDGGSVFSVGALELIATNVSAGRKAVKLNFGHLQMGSSRFASAIYLYFRSSFC